MQRGYTALHIASRRGHTDIVKLILLQTGMRVSMRSEPERCLNVRFIGNGKLVRGGESTALHLAALHGHLGVTEELLRDPAVVVVQEKRYYFVFLILFCGFKGRYIFVQLGVFEHMRALNPLRHNR